LVSHGNKRPVERSIIMKNKLGQGLAVGITAICAASIAITGLIVGQPETVLVMIAPVGVAFVILLNDGWENEV